ncbi:glycosyltransferase [Treponema sp.]|uniref:glycosyltransferase n=1 Tax=Treponema sp. TaxID=166 RepID=UPI003F0A3D58
MDNLCKQLRFRFVKKLFQSENPDVIHVHLGLLQYVKFAKSECKIFYTVHNEPSWVFDTNKREEKAARWLSHNRDFTFITLHEEMKCEIDRRFNINNSLILNNGINFERFDVNKVLFRQKLNIPENAFVVGHVGRFINQKNHNFLVDIFSEIKKKNPAAFLLMIGDGELKNQISEELDLLGLKNDYLILSNRTDIPELMKIMDVFVLPSNFEGLGIVLIYRGSNSPTLASKS